LSNNSSKKHWLWIEPYVHVTIKGHKALLYNTLSGAKLQYDYEPDILRILKKMLRPENLLVIPLTAKELNEPRISCFIQELKDNFMGDTEDVSFSKGKPVELKSILNIQADARRKKRDRDLEGKALLSYLKEVTLYINNSSAHKSIYEALPPLLHEQVLVPFIDGKGREKEKGDRQELSLDTIKTLYRSLENSGLVSINIIGGNILEYSRFEELAAFLDTTPRIKVYHLHYEEALEKLDRLSLIKDKKGKSRINLIVSFPFKEDQLEKALRFAQEQGNVKLTFLVANEQELEVWDSFTGWLGFGEFLLKPYYNGSNMDFLEEAVFIHPEDIGEANPTQ